MAGGVNAPFSPSCGIVAGDVFVMAGFGFWYMGSAGSGANAGRVAGVIVELVIGLVRGSQHCLFSGIVGSDTSMLRYYGCRSYCIEAQPSRVLVEGRLLSFAFGCGFGVEYGLSRRWLAKNGEAQVQEVRLLYDWRGWLFPSISSTHVK